MHKLMLLFLLAAFVAVVGCGSNQGEAPPGVPKEPTPGQKEPPKKPRIPPKV